MALKVILEPEHDSDNTIPEDLSFTVDNDKVYLHLKHPDRRFVLDADEFLKLLRFIDE